MNNRENELFNKQKQIIYMVAMHEFVMTNYSCSLLDKVYFDKKTVSIDVALYRHVFNFNVNKHNENRIQ
jgi:hypothetical protein